MACMLCSAIEPISVICARCRTPPMITTEMFSVLCAAAWAMSRPIVTGHGVESPLSAQPAARQALDEVALERHEQDDDRQDREQADGHDRAVVRGVLALQVGDDAQRQREEVVVAEQCDDGPREGVP